MHHRAYHRDELQHAVRMLRLRLLLAQAAVVASRIEVVEQQVVSGLRLQQELGEAELEPLPPGRCSADVAARGVHGQGHRGGAPDGQARAGDSGEQTMAVQGDLHGGVPPRRRGVHRGHDRKSREDRGVAPRPGEVVSALRGPPQDAPRLDQGVEAAVAVQGQGNHLLADLRPRGLPAGPGRLGQHRPRSGRPEDSGRAAGPCRGVGDGVFRHVEGRGLTRLGS
mmetsp:Transcript_69357/g.194474  ORF Transcript_69357/g.194474 Transcript_69357/m.194474 type:complete len:224 (-) Transcript_69357:52-723(-)